MIKNEELIPGLEFLAPNQGNNITPITKKGKVVWVTNDTVSYVLEGSAQVKNTPINRFLEIINQ